MQKYHQAAQAFRALLSHLLSLTETFIVGDYLVSRLVRATLTLVPANVYYMISVFGSSPPPVGKS